MVSQFFQLDRLVVEGGRKVRGDFACWGSVLTFVAQGVQTGSRGDIIRQTEDSR